MAFYYPEGYFGPVCDSLVSDEDIANRSRFAIKEDPDPRVTVFNGTPPGWYDEVIKLFDPPPPFFLGRKCKQRDDGTYYDCEDEFLSPITFDSPIDVTDIGFSDVFINPNTGTESCSPFDPDINIRPIIFYDANGNQVTKTKTQRSTPVTYAVTSDTSAIEQTSGSLTAAFNADSSALVISGTGTGNILLTLQWNDNPNTAGVAINTIQLGGQTWTRGDGAGGGAQTGSQTEGFQVVPGTYNITYSGLNAANNPIVQNSSTSLCLKDGHGPDCNANFTVTSLLSQDTVANAGYWSEEGNKYGVWTNPMVCTLPFITQTVTYLIPIPANDTYGFTFGCDDNASIFLNDDTTAFLTAEGGIFAAGANATPETGTKSLTAGTLKLQVSCTNSAAGFVDGDGKPVGDAFIWQRNPGGWYIKICRGGICSGSSNISWVRSGPHPAWPDFMDTYAVYPSNTATLEGINHAANWIATCPTAGDYTLECRADNWAQFVWDGTTLGSIGQNVAPFNASFSSSTTYTISGVTVGDHTLGVTVLNGTGNSDWPTNPGGVAFVLRDASNNVIMTSLDLDNAGNGNLIWHTRMAIGYDYETT